MSKLKKSKAEIEDEFRKINETNQVIDRKLDEAKDSGKNEEIKSLFSDLKTNKKREEFLQEEYSLLEEEEAKPELERIRKLTQELRNPPLPVSNYMGMGGLVATAIPENIRNSFVPVDYDKDLERKREIITEIGYAGPVPKGGMKEEMLPSSLLTQLGSLPTPESKAQLLEKTFGKGNIMPIDVGGRTEFVIKQPDGSTKTTLDRGVGGTLGAAAVEVPLIAAEVGAALGTLATTRSPMLAATAAAGTRGVLGTGIDETLRYAYGMDSDLGGSMARRGLEAAIGFGFDAGIAGVSGSLAARIPNPFENTFAKTLELSQQRLMTAEQKLAAKQNRPVGEIQVPLGGKLAGQVGVDVQSELAGQFPSTSIASSARSTQETLVRLFDDFRSDIPAVPNDFANIAAKKQTQRAALSQQISRLTGRSNQIIESALDRQTRGPSSNIDELGKIIRTQIKSSEERATAIRNEQYDVLKEVAREAGFTIRAEDLLKIVSQIKRRENKAGAFDESAVAGVENRLKARTSNQDEISIIQKRIDGEKDPVVIRNLTSQIQSIQNKGNLDFSDFDDFIKAFNDARPDNAVGGSTQDALGLRVSSGLSDLRKGIYSQFNAISPTGKVRNLGDEFEIATQNTKDRVAFEGNTLGAVLKEVVGEQATTPRDIVSAVLKEPATIDRVVKALREFGASDPSKASEADSVLGLLQVQYMNNIGINPITRGSSRVREVKPDQGMLNSIFGKNAPAVARSLQDININMRDAGRIDNAKLSIEDLRNISLPLPDQERKALAKTIVKRLQLEKESESLVNSQIFKLAQKGQFKNIDSDALSKSILSSNSTISDVSKAMSGLGKASLESRNLYKGDFLRELLDQYPGGTPTANASFTPLFDTKKFVADYESPLATGVSSFAKKLEIVLGKEKAERMYDLAKTYNANQILNVPKEGFPARTLGSGKGNLTLIVPFGEVTSAVKNRYIAAMLSSGSKGHKLKSALARNALPGDVNKAYNEMFKDLFLTKTGITAAAQQASSDPEFSSELLNMAKKFNKEKTDLNAVTQEK